MNKHRLAQIEERVLGLFRERGVGRLLTAEVFGGAPEYANADLVRAFEDLEKRLRLLVRFTEEGHDWLRLTPEGARTLGLPESAGDGGGVTPPPHPPKSAT